MELDDNRFVEAVSRCLELDHSSLLESSGQATSAKGFNGRTNLTSAGFSG